MKQINPRCPLQINPVEDLTEICPLGLKRAQWLAGNPSSSATEEKVAPGCTFGMLTEDCFGYCFFKFIHNREQALTEEEIARRLGLNVPQVKKILERALRKINGTAWAEEVEELYRDGDLDSYTEDDESNFYYDSSTDLDFEGGGSSGKRGKQTIASII